jgi:hypothetical protein
MGFNIRKIKYPFWKVPIFMSLSSLSSRSVIQVCHPGLSSRLLQVCSRSVPGRLSGLLSSLLQPGSSQVPARFQPGSSQVPARFKFAFHNLYCILAVLIEFVCLHCLCELISLIRARTILVVVIFESAASIIVLFRTGKYGWKDTLHYRWFDHPITLLSNQVCPYFWNRHAKYTLLECLNRLASKFPPMNFWVLSPLWLPQSEIILIIGLHWSFKHSWRPSILYHKYYIAP